MPGGRRLIFLLDAQSRGSYSDIATVRRDGRGVRRVVLGSRESYRHNLELAPDGHRLAFIEHATKPVHTQGSLRILNLRTGKLQTISRECHRTGDGRGLDPAGTRIVYLVTWPAVGRFPPSSVFTIRPDGSDRKLLFTLPFDEHRGLWARAPRCPLRPSPATRSSA